ncbi:hypothetical protein DW999_04235 [Ruminococcus sp. AM54-14NS]|nr:hypothetical protein DW999_04235 [Ruminococcus sp. AM54-14NS]
MTIYETIKAAISVKQAAEHYGLKVSHNGMACCPFHNDRHPSLKLNEDYFFCFGCGAKGDVIDLVARLFDLSSYEAAQKLAADFGLDPKPPTAAAMVKPKRPYIRQLREDEMLCFRVLTNYLHLLEDWKVRYAPKTPEDALDDRFVEACQMHCYIEYMADVLTVGDLEERVALVDKLMQDGKIAFLQEYITRKKKEVAHHAKNRKTPDMNLPVWFDGQNINEALFCEEFLQERRIIFANGAFFTPNGRVTDDLPLRGEIYDKLKFCAVNNIPRKITNILEVLKLEAQVPDFPPEQDRIHLSNGTLLLDGTFTEGRPAIVRSRLPVAYNPNAPAPEIWQNFLDGLLHAEDIPTLQEFIGYCLIPSNKGQRMMVIKGNGGEGKSQIGAVLSSIFGTNMKDGSIGKISENRFARADLEHILLCVDDDMRMEALRQTNYVKSIVTAQGKMDLERKGKQSYQGWMFARLLAFSNGDLQALYDRSDGFYRRQLVLTTKERPVNRADDPDLAEKMKAEAEGIFLWALEGLRRLVASNFKFTESDRIRENREAVKRDNNNIFDFMESEGYIRRKADASISSKDFYEIYRMWCEENSLAPLKARSFSDAMIANAGRFNLEHCNNITNSAGRRVWGFMGVEAVARPHINGFYDVSPCTYVPEGWRE